MISAVTQSLPTKPGARESDHAILANFLSPHKNQKQREKFESNRAKKIIRIPGGVVSHQNISHKIMGHGFFLTLKEKKTKNKPQTRILKTGLFLFKNRSQIEAFSDESYEISSPAYLFCVCVYVCVSFSVMSKSL